MQNETHIQIPQVAIITETYYHDMNNEMAAELGDSCKQAPDEFINREINELADNGMTVTKVEVYPKDQVLAIIHFTRKQKI